MLINEMILIRYSSIEQTPGQITNEMLITQCNHCIAMIKVLAHSIFITPSIEDEYFKVIDTHPIDIVPLNRHLDGS